MVDVQRTMVESGRESRTILFIGDSITQHFFFAAVGSIVQHLPDAVISMQVKDRDVFAARIELNGILFLSMEVIFTTGYSGGGRTGWLLQPLVAHINTLPPDAVVVLNMGLWFHDASMLRNATRPLIEALISRHDATNGTTLVIWRSSNAQHFNVPDGSYYVKESPTHPALPTPNPNECVELNETTAQIGNWQESALKSMLMSSKLGKPIPFFELTVPWWRVHSLYSEQEERASIRPRQRAHMTLGRIPDCTHPCLGGAMRHWLPVWAAFEESVRVAGKVYHSEQNK
jgi:hypothetical protein